MTMAKFKPSHFNWRVDNKVAVITLMRPERKNPMTFDSYAELRDTFRQLAYEDDIKAAVIGSNGGTATLTLRIDHTPPTIVATVTPAAISSGTRVMPRRLG